MHWFLKFIFGMKFYMFRTGFLSNIRSVVLYTQQWVRVMQVMLTVCWLDHDGTVPSSPWIRLLDIIHWERRFIHSIFCLTICPTPLPKRFFHTVRSTASSFKWDYPLLSLRSSSRFLRLPPRLIATSISPFYLSFDNFFRRQFLRIIWPIQLTFRFLISCRIFLCPFTLSNTSSLLTWSVQLMFSILLQHHISKFSTSFWSIARNVPV